MGGGDGERRLGVIRQFDSWNILKGERDRASHDGGKREGYAAGATGHDHVCSSGESPSGRGFRQQIRDVQAQDGIGISFSQGEKLVWLEAAAKTGGDISLPLTVSGFSGEMLMATGPFSGVSGRKSILVKGPS